MDFESVYYIFFYVRPMVENKEYTRPTTLLLYL